MKKILKILGIIILTIIVILYLCFLFVLPNVVKLDDYKPMVKQLVKEQAHLDLDYGDLKVITTPLLSVGLKTDNISLKFEDGSELFSSDKVKARVALPSLLFMTVKVSCFDVENPKVYLSIEDGKDLKILQHVEKILIEQEKNIGEKPATEDVSEKFDVSKIKIKIPNVKFKNYSIKADDLKNKHNLILSGEELKLGYFNGKTAKLKTDAVLKSDNEQKITANISIDTFLPAPTKLDEEDDKMQRAELPYANVVDIYRTYNLMTDINAKIKIREKKGIYNIKGYSDIDNLTMQLSNYALPKSYVHTKFKGSKVFVDTDLKIAQNQGIKISGYFKGGKKPNTDLSIITDKIYFKSLFGFAKGVMDTFQIKNNLDSIDVNGYTLANANIKTDLKKLKSDGQIIIREGDFSNKKTGLNIKDAKADIIFDNNVLNIKDTQMLVDSVPFYAKGIINEKSVADIRIITQNLPLKTLYNTFAPPDLKKNYSLNSGNLSLDVNLKGELKNAIANAKASLNDFSFSDKSKNIVVTNKKADVDFALTKNYINGTLKNTNLQVYLPKSTSVIKSPDLKITVDNRDIIVEPSKLFLNKNSEITYLAVISNWQTKQLINFYSGGKFDANDIKHLAGNEAGQFIRAKGSIPVNLTYNGEGSRHDLELTLLSDNNNYVTPINITSLVGKPSSIHSKIAFKQNRLKVKETGLFERTEAGLKEVVGLEGTIVNLSMNPFINLFTVRVPKELNISLNGFKNAALTFGGKLYAFGNVSTPRFKGGFYIKNAKISDLLMSVNKIDLNLSGRNFGINVDKLNLNGSDIDINSKMGLNQTDVFTIDEVNISSKDIDVDKAVKVAEAASKLTPKTNSSKTQAAAQGVPLLIKNGKIKIDRLKTGNIVVSNILSDLSLSKNIFYINNLRANAFDGKLLGNIAMNLASNILHIQAEGADINSEKAALDAANLKDVITGKLSFYADLVMDVAASTFENQMKSIEGTIDFIIQNGQLGPFGKLENMILAENIRESSFFQTALGGVINNLTSIDTTHFENMNGHIIMKNAIVGISPVYSNGSVLNLYLFGNFDILKNSLDMKVRAKLGSEISNMLGPISALNPINLVKATPGLNVAMAKTFALFCEELSADEMAVIPSFPDKLAEFNATKFQIVLRGDVAKPLSLVKSFKWLVTETQFLAAKNYVATLPEPEVTGDGKVLQTAEEIEAYNKKLSTKIKKGTKKVLNKFRKNKDTAKSQESSGT